ncbi:MAG: helix-turn-helix domain-containing protein [Chitinophagaceae bacterium]
MGHYSFFNLVSAIFGVSIAVVLLISSVKNKLPNRFLGIAFLLLAFRSLTIFTIQEDLIYNTFLMGSVSCWYYFIPPSLYLYIRKIIHDDQSIRKSDLGHFIIPILAVLLLIYYLIAGFSETGQLSLPEQRTKLHDESTFSIYLQIAHHARIIVLMSVVYTILAWRQVIRYLKKSKKEHPQVAKMRNWILALLGFCTILCTILFLSAILNWTLNYKIPQLDLANLNIVRSLVLILLFTRVVIKRDLLLGIPSLKTALPDIESAESLSYNLREAQPAIIHHPESDTEASIIESEDTNALYIDSNGWIQKLDEDTGEKPLNIEVDKINLYIEQINAYLASAPYTDPDFDLKTISTALSIPYYHLEYLFRYYNQYSFSEFRNVLRVRHVLQALDKGEREEFSLEELGQKAGFSSRSSFFRVFKQVTGKTPKQYL